MDEKVSSILFWLNSNPIVIAVLKNVFYYLIFQEVQSTSYFTCGYIVWGVNFQITERSKLACLYRLPLLTSYFVAFVSSVNIFHFQLTYHNIQYALAIKVVHLTWSIRLEYHTLFLDPSWRHQDHQSTSSSRHHHVTSSSRHRHVTINSLFSIFIFENF